MGNWSVVSATGNTTELASPFGHNLHVVFRRKFAPSLVGAFVEPPILAWDEIIM